MTREESRDRLAAIVAVGADGHHIDLALEDGFCCPECGGEEFLTLQREEVWQRFSRETLKGWGDHEHVPESTVTVGLMCEGCGCNLWGEQVKEEAASVAVK